MHKQAREPTGQEKEIQDKLDALLSGERKEYVVIQREGMNEANPALGTYRLYGNVGTEEAVIVHLLNFIDGLLENDHFAYFASLVSKRALERMGVNLPTFLEGGGEAKPN